MVHLKGKHRSVTRIEADDATIVRMYEGHEERNPN